MEKTPKLFAVLAYLLSAAGALYVLCFRRRDRFACYHARQSLGIAVAALLILAAWGILGWLLSWIPFVGFIGAMALFSLVIAAYIGLTIACLVGIRRALTGQEQPVPFVGQTILRYFPW